MSGWTKGPWVAKAHGVIVGGDSRQHTNGSAQPQIAMACVVSESENATEERDANARLIAAAPDLAEALEFFYRQMWDGSQIDWALEKARAALEKAGAQ